MNLKTRLGAALLASLLLLGGFMLGRSSAPAAPSPAACAYQLGIAWSPEEGATERLTDFDRCLEGRPPLGVALQREVGIGYEVTFDPATGIFTIEPE